MSWQSVGWVYERSPFTNAGPFSVHVAMAEVVNGENRNEFWMSMDKLARKSRTSRATAMRTVATMVEIGLLRVLESRQGGTTRYRMLFPVDAPVTYDQYHGDTPDDEEVRHGDTGTSRVVTQEVARGDTGGVSPRGTNQKRTSTETELDLEEVPRVDSVAMAFETWWLRYPARDGRTRGDKKRARALWGKLSAEDRARAEVAVGHYAAGTDSHFVKNAEGWLAARYFDDWQTPGKPRGQAEPGSPRFAGRWSEEQRSGSVRRGEWSDD